MKKQARVYSLDQVLSSLNQGSLNRVSGVLLQGTRRKISLCAPCDSVIIPIFSSMMSDIWKSQNPPFLTLMTSASSIRDSEYKKNLIQIFFFWYNNVLDCPCIYLQM